MSLRPRVAVAWATVSVVAVSVGRANPGDVPLTTDAGAAQGVAWWRDAKFDLLVHWGV